MDFSILMKDGGGSENILSPSSTTSFSMLLPLEHNSRGVYNNSLLEKNNNIENSSSSINISYSKTILAMQSESLQSVPVSELLAKSNGDINIAGVVDMEDIESAEGLNADSVSDSSDSTTRGNDDDDDDKIVSSTSKSNRSTMIEDNNNNNNNEASNCAKESSFLDKIAGKKYVLRLVVISSSLFFVLDVVLLCFFLTS